MDVLLDEVESLEAILMEDVTIKRNPESGTPELIETTVFPTVGGDTDRQYVCVTLQVVYKSGYPETSPDFKLLKPRGLDDCRLANIREACIQKLDESRGEPVVFDLIEVIREHLTGSNLPSGQCVVCLYGFQEGDEFTKTECYHYLHSYCLARHLVASQRNHQEEQDKLPAWQRKLAKPYQAVCPVCREAISDDFEHLSNAPPPVELEKAPDFCLTDDLKELQAKMSNLYFRQKKRGGIIDLDATEKNIISLEPEGRNGDEIKPVDENTAEAASEPSINTDVVASQQQQQENASYSRSNTQRGHTRVDNRNTVASPINTSQQRYTAEPMQNNYSNHHNQHHRRGHGSHHHGHYHHRGRRYYNQYGNQHDQSQPQKANSHAPSGSASR